MHYRENGMSVACGLDRGQVSWARCLGFIFFFFKYNGYSIDCLMDWNDIYDLYFQKVRVPAV